LLSLVATILVLGPPAHAQWEGNFTGEITAVNDPENRFQGVVQIGTPVVGTYSYELPYGQPGVLACTVGTAVLNSYDYWYVYAIDSEPGAGSDLFHLETFTLHPPEFQQPAPGIYNDGSVLIDLEDSTGTALSSSELMDLPLGNSWLGGFNSAGGEFQLWETPDFVDWQIVASARFNITSYETFVAPMMGPSPSFVSVAETVGTAIVTVRRVGDASGTASVDYTTADTGSALAGADYVATSGTLTFSPGVTSQSFTVTILDDALREGAEYFGVEFSNVTGGGPTAFSATVEIQDDEPPPPDISVRYPNVIESDGVVTFTVERSGDLSEPTTLDYGTADGTAVAGEDYVAANGSLTFAPGEASHAFTVTLVVDSILEDTEQFAVNFNNVVGAAPSAFQAGVTIFDPVPLAVDPKFDPGVGADGPVYDLIPLRDGRILALGTFTHIGGLERPFMARLKSNGKTDRQFTAGRNKGGFDAPLNQVLPVHGGRLLVAGQFTTIGGRNQQYLARLEEDGELDRSFRPAINGSVSRAAVQPDRKIVIVGSFTEVDGVPRNNIARLDAQGRLDRSFDPGGGPDIAPAAVALQPDGRILVGGRFTRFAGIPRRCVARLLPRGAVDPDYDLQISAPFSNPIVTKFIVREDGSHFLVGQSFYQVAGENLDGSIVLLTRDGAVDPSFRSHLFANFPPTAADVMPDGRLVLSGAFQWTPYPEPDPTIGYESYGLWRLNPDGSLDLSLDPRNFPRFFADPVKVLDVSVDADGDILLAGDFAKVSGVPRAGMARIIGNPNEHCDRDGNDDDRDSESEHAD
jgi:uncharacterized delta-60 repeat protein